MPNPICQVHNAEMKLVPAGTSRKTGKPYNAFYACQIQGCSYRPPQDQNTQQRPTPSVRDATIIRQVAFKGAIDLVVAGKIDSKDVRKYTDGFERVINNQPATVPQGTEELPVIDQNDDMMPPDPINVDDIPF